MIPTFHDASFRNVVETEPLITALALYDGGLLREPSPPTKNAFAIRGSLTPTNWMPRLCSCKRHSTTLDYTQARGEMTEAIGRAGYTDLRHGCAGWRLRRLLDLAPKGGCMTN